MTTYTTQEAADLLRVTARTVRKLYDDGLLTGYRTGPRGDRVITKASLVRLVDHHPRYRERANLEALR